MRLDFLWIAFGVVLYFVVRAFIKTLLGWIWE